MSTAEKEQAFLPFKDDPVWREKFEKYHEANPRVYELFKRFAREAKARRKRYSASAIFERIRWHSEVETNGGDFKINNYFRPWYARKLMEECPEFRGFFETRRLRST